jgi:uncharacterized membrane protein SirB2
MTLLLLIHKGCVIITSTGFVIRWALSLRDSELLSCPLFRILPHWIDATLFFSGLGMLWVLSINPQTTPWLMAKFLALLGYILLGHLALKPRYPYRLRLSAGVAALASLVYIVAVAITRQALPWQI